MHPTPAKLDMKAVISSNNCWTFLLDLLSNLNEGMCILDIFRRQDGSNLNQYY